MCGSPQSTSEVESSRKRLNRLAQSAKPRKQAMSYAMILEPRKLSKFINKLVDKYDAVPPPWFMYPGTHPYSIVWRMGGGEVYLCEIFPTWWEDQKDDMDEAERIKYFRRWPPPPRWLLMMIQHIWDVESIGITEGQEEFDNYYSPFFKKTEDLGFGSQDDYERDIEVPRPLPEVDTDEFRNSDWDDSSDDTSYEFLSEEESSDKEGKKRGKD